MKTERVLKKNAIKAYKAFDSDLTCRGFQYEVGKEYHHKGELEMCESGFHACERLVDCFRFYPFRETKTRVAEVLVWGKVKYEDTGVKLCASNIKVVRELAWSEVLFLCNSGYGNSGYGNTGNDNTGNNNGGSRNSGYWNSGNHNTGNNNTGNHNSGDCNSGNHNTGDWNSGSRNSGNWNTGNWNSGNGNSGNWNSGNSNSGNYNSGYWNSGNSNSGEDNSGNHNTGSDNSGDWNSGDCNSGNYNTGNGNSGDWNSGNGNSGDWNSGNSNSGNYNTGNGNSGNYNTGDWNSGNWNSGNWNSGNWNSGYLNTSAQKYSFIFNKQVEKSVLAQIEFPEFMRFTLTDWIPDYKMSQQEKERHPEYVTTGGYLKEYTYKEAFRKSFEVARRKSDWPKQRQMLLNLPNFDAKIFEEISGIKEEELI